MEHLSARPNSLGRHVLDETPAHPWGRVALTLISPLSPPPKPRVSSCPSSGIRAALQRPATGRADGETSLSRQVRGPAAPWRAITARDQPGLLQKIGAPRRLSSHYLLPHEAKAGSGSVRTCGNRSQAALCHGRPNALGSGHSCSFIRVRLYRAGVRPCVDAISHTRQAFWGTEMPSGGG